MGALGGGADRAAPQRRYFRRWHPVSTACQPPPPNQPHGAAPRGPTGATRGIFNPGFGVGCRGRRESGGAVRGLAGSCVTFKGPRDALRGSDRPSGSAPVRLSAGRGFLFRVSPRSDPRPNAAGSALRAAAPIALSARTAPIPARLRCGATGGGTGGGSVLRPHPSSRSGSALRALSATSGFGNPPAAFLPPSLSAALLTQRFGECPLLPLAAR